MSTNVVLTSLWTFDLARYLNSSPTTRRCPVNINRLALKIGALLLDCIAQNDDFLEIDMNGLFIFTLWTPCTLRSMRDTFRKISVSALRAQKRKQNIDFADIGFTGRTNFLFWSLFSNRKKNRFRLQGNIVNVSCNLRFEVFTAVNIKNACLAGYGAV
jgi:hypothetical protein